MSKRQSAPYFVVHLFLYVALQIAVFWFGAATVVAEVPDGRALKSGDKALRAQFERAVDKYLKGDFQLAEQELRELADHPGLSNRGREVASFMIGKCLYEEAAYGVCRNYFESYIENFPRSPYVAAAHIYTGHALFQLGEYAASARSYVAALTARTDDYTSIALENVEPLIRWSLSQADLENLLTSLNDSPDHDWPRLWIADRWNAEGRSRLSEALYQEIASHSRKSGPTQIALERLGSTYVPDPRMGLTVGLIGPMSGEFAEFGAQMEHGARLAAAQFNMSANLIILDTNADSARAATLIDTLAQLGCDVVIGPLLSSAIRGTAPLLDKRRIVQVLPLARRDGFAGEFNHVFQMSRSPADQGEALGNFAVRDVRNRQLGAIASDTPEGRAAAEAFAATVADAGATMHPIQYFQPGDTDFGEQLRTLKRRTSPSDVPLDEAIPTMDGILVWGDPEDIVLIAPQIPFHSFRVHAYGPAGWSEKDALSRLRTSLDSIVFISYEWVDESRASWKTFKREYQSEWKLEPTPLAGRVYDAVTWAVSLPFSPGKQDGLLQSLTRDEGLDGVSGHWQFDRGHYPSHWPLLHYVNGRIVPVVPR